MSLVNDMLRDLDQRRRESEGPAARIRLTPAGDYRRQEHKNWIPFIGLGLAIVASGLGYIWIDMNRSASSRELSVAVPPTSVIQATPVEQVAEEALAVAAPVIATVEPEPEINLNASLEEVLTQGVLQEKANTPAPLSEPAENANLAGGIQNIAAVIDPAPVANAGLAAAPVSLVPAATVRTQSPGTVAPEQIKGVTALSPEQRDTIVVQDALQLIANNDPTAAYAKLEQHLLDNPYAHQSRETYAKFLMSQGDIPSASALMDSGLELAPNHSGFKKVKARLFIEKGDIESAVNLLESRAPAVSSDLEYHEILASAQLASRDFDGAVLSYTGLVQQDQTQGRWWYGFAAAQDALGNMTAAKQAYSRALEKQNLSTNLRRRSQDRLTALNR